MTDETAALAWGVAVGVIGVILVLAVRYVRDVLRGEL